MALNMNGCASVRHFAFTHEGEDVGEAQLHSDAMIWGVEIYEPYRGQGYGRLLMLELLKVAAQEHSVVFLFVRRDNIPAIKLYESLGFEVYDQSRRGLHMCKPLEDS